MTTRHRERSSKPGTANAKPGDDGLKKAHAALKAAYDQIIVPGRWTGKIVRCSSVTLGGMQQNGRHPHATELSYAFWIAMVKPPKTEAELPVILVALTGGKTRYVYPASFNVDARTLVITLSIHVDRPQFSDLVRHSERNSLDHLSFSLEGSKDAWCVKSWAIRLKTPH